MNKIIKIALYSLIIYLVVVFLIWLSGGFKKAKYEYASPDKQYILELFDYNGGATTGFFTTLVIRKNGGFVSKLFRYYIFNGEYNPNKVEIKWIENNVIRIIHPETVIDKKRTRWKNIEIRYEVSDIEP